MNPILMLLKGVFGRSGIGSYGKKPPIDVSAVDPVRRIIWRQVNYTSRRMIVNDREVVGEIEAPEVSNLY